MKRSELHVMVTSPHDKQSPGTVMMTEWGQNERLMRGFKFFGLCWGAAVLAVFIPILHFVLVPLLLLAGPLVGYYFYQQERMLMGGSGTCPECNAALKIERGAAKWPLDEMCTHCRSLLSIRTRD